MLRRILVVAAAATLLVSAFLLTAGPALANNTYFEEVLMRGYGHAVPNGQTSGYFSSTPSYYYPTPSYYYATPRYFGRPVSPIRTQPVYYAPARPAVR